MGWEVFYIYNTPISSSTQVAEGVGLENREVAKSGAEVRIFSGAISVMMRITYYGVSLPVMMQVTIVRTPLLL